MFLYTALTLGLMGFVSGEVFTKTAPFDSVKEQLGVAFNSTAIDPPGALLPLSGEHKIIPSSFLLTSTSIFSVSILKIASLNMIQIANCSALVPVSEPSLSIPNRLNKGVYLLIMVRNCFLLSPKNHPKLNLQVDPNAGKPDFLHWFQTNLTSSRSSLNKDTSFLTSQTPAIDPYIKPQPPPGTGRHRYTEFLFQQPVDFAIPAAFAKIVRPRELLNRAGFNLTAFVEAAGLDTPVAANFFFAENSKSTPSASSGTGTSPSCMWKF